MRGDMKTCFKCGATKPLSEFYKHPQMPDGHLNKCKVCTRHDVRENYQARREQYLAYDRQRRPRNGRRTIEDEAKRARKQEWTRRDKELHPEKWRARAALARAVKTGKVARAPCEVCGRRDAVQAHHDDYNRPLDVHWLCPPHHAEVTMGHVRAQRLVSLCPADGV